MNYPVIVSTSNLSVDPDTQKAIDEFNARQERLHDPAYLRTPEGKKEEPAHRHLRLYGLSRASQGGHQAQIPLRGFSLRYGNALPYARDPLYPSCEAKKTVLP